MAGVITARPAHRRRGRPRTVRDEQDRGTPEMQRYKHSAYAYEPIDLYLLNRLVTTRQHWCAIHFRWLFTLRYGTATPKAVDTASLAGMERRCDNPLWQAEREEEWRDALARLDISQLRLLTRCAVHNEDVLSVRRCSEPVSSAHALLVAALDRLAREWCRPAQRI